MTIYVCKFYNLTIWLVYSFLFLIVLVWPLLFLLLKKGWKSLTSFVSLHALQVLVWTDNNTIGVTESINCLSNLVKVQVQIWLKFIVSTGQETWAVPQKKITTKTMQFWCIFMPDICFITLSFCVYPNP